MAKQQIVFDLARNIDFQSRMVMTSNEKAVGGRTSGLIGPGETVTWYGKHLGVWQHLTTKITDFDEPHFFADEMVKKGLRFKVSSFRLELA
ncbi:hypothetical protein LZ575_17685 [Antarcticibacterium sp. 1MA-6-2]|uniref:hypothetical protein n=1 Tax=Antarcticibacterium sp. 1MA-6-2 TaxID=2908210 RepID=UPI001F19C99F|nr:hypothetical protein [Antarcticibacterium sp. 1MA-6-2]UJH90595.1 hypothetical protein LZ575_17685 [Antarcticibacterium sp. 1MA-6-2]